MMKNFIYVIPFLLGGLFCYSLFYIKKDFKMVSDYSYEGRIQQKMKFSIKDELYLPDSTVLNVKGGVISDYKIAAQVGIVLIRSMFGNDEVELGKPFIVEKDIHSWNMYGSGESAWTNASLGVMPEISIDRATGKLIHCSHGK